MRSFLVRYALFTAVFFICCVQGISAQTNLLANGGFEDGTLEPWRQDTWQQIDGSLKAALAAPGKEGLTCAVMTSTIPEDSKLVQTVTVKPRTLYRLSGWIRVDEPVNGNKGANLSALEISDTTGDVKDSRGEWVYRELYGKTERNQKELSVTLRLGGYGALAEGTVYFDDIRLEEVETLPKGSTAVSLRTKTLRQPDAAKESKPVTGLLYVSVLYAILMAVMFSRVPRSFLEQRSGIRLSIFLVAAALVLRYLVAWNIPGHSTDVVCFKAWSSEVFSLGIHRFYASESFKDYPPLYMYVLYLVGALRALFHLSFDSKAFLLLVKTPAILADIAGALMLLRLSRNKWTVPVFAAYLFNPAVILNSAAYAQVDSVFTLFLVFMCAAFFKRRFVLSAAFLGALIAMKPQGFVFAGIGMFFACLFFVAKLAGRYPAVTGFCGRFGIDLDGYASSGDGPSGSGGITVKTLGLSVLAAAGVYVVACLPFFVAHPNEFIALYSRIFASYPYASVNAFNFFSLLGGNWKADTARLLGVTVVSWSRAAAVLTAAFGFLVFLRNRDKARPFAAVLVLAVLSVTFMARIHERYLYPALFPAAALFLLSGRKQYLGLFLSLSVLLFINQGIVLFESMKQVFHIPSDSLVLKTGSFFMVAAAVWTIILVTGRDIPLPAAEIPRSERKKDVPLLNEHNRLLRFGKPDGIILLVLILVVGFISFIHLGSWKSPQTWWQPAVNNAEARAVLAQPERITEIGYFSGLGTGTYDVLCSTDGQEFRHIAVIENTNNFAEFEWHTISVDADCRYILLRVTKPGFSLYEFIAKSGSRVVSLSYTGTADPAGENNPAHLFDEADTFPDQISHKTGMYFDEIYYPRSSVQYLQGKRVQETTHPELGKLIMTAFIKVLGLRPLVWRMPGVLAGIIMLPGLYLLSRRLFFRRDTAVFITILFGLDFMRFTQTRVATIDSFSVMFIVLMYLFMARYFFTVVDSFDKKNLWKLAWPVLLSGIAFGLGAATKWTSLYAGLGLGILYFWKLYQLVLQGSGRRGKIVIAAAACGWGLVTFVLIPGFIYLVSYYPLMQIYGAKDLIGFVVKRQADMYRYHSRLQATHPFSSSWWQWPLIMRPIWYYSGQPFLPQGVIGNIVNMGTPVIWWLGIPALVLTGWGAVKKQSRAAWFILIAFGSQYIPWIGSPRKLVFLYHFFAAVPFMLMAIAWSIEDSLAGREKARRVTGFVLIGLAVVLFGLFFPVLSGTAVPKAYAANVLRWFKSWVLFN